MCFRETEEILPTFAVDLFQAKLNILILKRNFLCYYLSSTSYNSRTSYDMKQTCGDEQSGLVLNRAVGGVVNHYFRRFFDT